VKKTRILLATALLALTAATTRAEIITDTVEYPHDGAVLEGAFVYDNTAEGPRPAVIIFHQWGGPGDYELKRATMIAELGYVAFVADIYGKGIRPATFDERSVLATAYRSDRPMLRARTRAALDTVAANPRIDTNRIVAIGYCFGGTAALELARDGAPLAGAVSIHGALNTPTPEDANNITAPLLIQHGAIDPYVPAEEVDAFRGEMAAAGVDYTFINYDNAVHSFTDWFAGDDPSTGAAYNPEADAKSWEDLKTFLRERF
jgi:dienelactone hydrolase